MNKLASVERKLVIACDVLPTPNLKETKTKNKYLQSTPKK